MTADPKRVIVTTGATAHVVQVHQQDMTELGPDRESPEIAAVIPALPYRHVHNPVFGADRPSCPVCGKATYSHGGIHPQCSAEREARTSDAALRAARKVIDE